MRSRKCRTSNLIDKMLGLLVDTFWPNVRLYNNMLRKNHALKAVALLCLAATSIVGCAGPSNSHQSATAKASDAPFELKDVSFDSSGVSLSGRLFAPRRGSYSVVIYVTGSGDDEVNTSAYPRLLATAFAQSGIGLFAYNKRGVGQSRGTYSESSFEQRAQDTVAALRFVKSLPGVDAKHVGMFGISQGGWVIPKAIQQAKDTAFVILVSPAGVNPKRQMDFYLQNEWRSAGMNDDEIKKASALHDVLFQYFATGQHYDRAQSAARVAEKEGLLDKYRQARFREEVPKSGRLPSPAELEAMVKKDPSELEFYRNPSSAADYYGDYLHLTMPTLIIYGGKDSLVPVSESMALFKKALAENHNRSAEFKVFEEGDHAIQESGSPYVLSGYPEFMRDWILKNLGDE
jgi:uncharacterized protein